MSARALKRLERQRLEKELSATPEGLADNDDEEEEEEYEEPAKPKINAFALLNDQDESEEEGSDFDKPEPPKEEVKPVTLPTKSTKKLKKKKAKKKAVKKDVDDYSDDEFDRILQEVKQKDEVSHEGLPAAESKLLDAYDFEEELDLITEPQDVYDSNFKYFTTKRLKESLPLLSIGAAANLDQDNEYKILFGNLSMDAIDDANASTALAISPEVLQQFKRLARLTRGWGGKDRRGVPGTTRKLLLSKIRDDWLPTTLKPMNMEEIRPEEYVKFLDYKEEEVSLEELQMKVQSEAELGVKYFQFSKINDIKERVANTRFYASVVMTPDPESLMQLLQQYPYHVETLLQVAMVLLRQGDNKATSNALVERALFAFDRTFHKNFHELLSLASNGLVRLPYERFMNRQFHLCLFRYIVALGERSTFYTALTYCKLLLSLNPAEDPLGVRYFIDFYAIMSEEFKYLVQFTESPLVKTYAKWLTPGLAFSTVLAQLKLDQTDKAREALRYAFEHHPYTAFRLYQLIGLGSDLPFKDSSFNVSTEVLIATETYLIRCGVMWNDHGHRQFLHDELQKLFAGWKPEKSKTISSSLFGLLGFSSGSENEEVPFNLLRFAILSGENRIIAKLPQKLLSRNDLFEYDLVPPNQSNDQPMVLGMLQQTSRIVDHLIDYVDQNLLGSIIQNRTAEEQDFDEIVRGIEQQNVNDEAEQ
ncbi:Ribosome quality control complex subunit 1 [Candida viswanathii]|uniref:Ribosome quality control complex subunit 1 n=1 Tax=Candida viswanathii TaxID=5486 RepID=A0A367YP05_9ASCO|nr:Ribosome quality control complex subunit 1 [Candida viswanathii]